VLKSIFQMETVQADLLIGADGINSVVRRGIIGDGFPNYAGRMSWRSFDILTSNCLPTVITSSNGQNSMLMDVGMVIPLGYKCIIGRRLCQSTGNRC